MMIMKRFGCSMVKVSAFGTVEMCTTECGKMVTCMAKARCYIAIKTYMKENSILIRPTGTEFTHSKMAIHVKAFGIKTSPTVRADKFSMMVAAMMVNLEKD